jgi:serine palmitoyltransferase
MPKTKASRKAKVSRKKARSLSTEKKVSSSSHIEEPEIPWVTAVTTFFSYGLLMFFGYVRDYYRLIVKPTDKAAPPGYAPWVQDWEDFFTRRLYRRIEDCWNRPICSNPGASFQLMKRERKSNKDPFTVLDESEQVLNLGSYNYLGFGDPDSVTKASVMDALENYSISTCSARPYLGTTELHRRVERLVAEFLQTEDSLIFGMGYGTNSTGIPALIGKGGLIISDSNNHASIVTGARTSGAKIKVFRHNDVEDLELVVRDAIINGQPRTHLPWTKILILVEGIYSMEGQMSPLAEIVAIKKKYKCYLMIDEAHSIGAIGSSGRGITEEKGVSTADVDIMMGTFTKSFGAVGGYIAGSYETINFLRNTCVGSVHSASISPPACQQILAAMGIIMGTDGTELGATKLKQLRDNSDYFRKKVTDMGFHVLGDYGSPVVPIMIYQPAKIAAFSRECLKRKLAVVVVGFPAAPLLLSRTRICISAAHTREQLDDALEKISEVGDLLNMKYAH